MKMNGVPILLVPLPTRVAYVFRMYAKDKKITLNEKQAEMLKRYSENVEIAEYIVNTHFEHWYSDRDDRKTSLEEWTENVIQDLLKIYE